LVINLTKADFLRSILTLFLKLIEVSSSIFLNLHLALYTFLSLLWVFSRLSLYSIIKHNKVFWEMWFAVMAGSETVLGTSKVDPRFRITLVQPIPEVLGVNVGDLIVFVRDNGGNVIIKVSSISSVSHSKARS
jgi:hypothetical protein